MSLTPDELKKIAHLARLNLSSEDIAHYSDQLSKIITFIEKMDEKDTSAVEPINHPLELTQRLRADHVTEPDERDKFQSIAPATEAGLYLVPKVIDEA